MPLNEVELEEVGLLPLHLPELVEKGPDLVRHRRRILRGLFEPLGQRFRVPLHDVEVHFLLAAEVLIDGGPAEISLCGYIVDRSPGVALFHEELLGTRQDELLPGQPLLRHSTAASHFFYSLTGCQNSVILSF